MMETPATGWRGSKWLAAAEFAVVALIFLADQRHLIPLSKTPFLLALGWISLRVRGLGWRDVGFTLPRSWGTTLAVGIAGGALMETFQLLVTQPLLTRLTGAPPDLSDFRVITGNIKITLVALALTWTLAAFGEELAWRGYLMNRAADLGGRTRAAWMASLIAVNLLFGLAHANQGATGIIEESIAGVMLGLLYLGTGRNLAVPIIAHGIQDTIDVVLIFFGKFPGM
ncbi:MAG TPA: CPBP family intramembrane glutamic endopeptidase [Candidatus Acidoferrales bacterium]|nr:CPBP family intramembrane glutamic endopeptidase [Candidatus Acidoferrales bacterium]